ncbi:hypothetical protein F4808DRAFT_266005 [Astrocystis sublimbata]|nr:hypothetical protein F4808DRAFT_266005 [Astrocystis sublimbata]
MGRLSRTSLLFSTAATVASANSACIEAVSWGEPRIDLFSWAPDQSISHKFFTGWDWQPEAFERIPSKATSCPSASSWGADRLDLVWVNRSDETVLHKYIAGGAWGPSWEGAVDLGGGGDIDLVDTYSWGEGRLDIVANAFNGSFLHKAWTGSDYYPAGKDWEDLGGNFSGLPSVGSWGENRLDVVGIAAENGTLLHKYWHGTDWSDWINLGGGPFIGKPAISSWGYGRIDIWALDEDKALQHKFWDGYQWNGWEKLGGKFSQTPRVVHWDVGRIDIVGKNADDDKFYLKSFDGHNWNPSIKEWYELSGPYGSEPRLVTWKGKNLLYLFGADKTGSLRMQLWTGYEWKPASNETWPLGNVSEPYPEKKSDSFAPEDQHVLLGNEL